MNPPNARNKARSPIIAIFLVAPLLTLASTASAQAPSEPQDWLATVDEALADAANCSLPNHYDPEDEEFTDTFNDDGFATFWNGFELAGLFGYDGSGGHTGQVLMCTTGYCKGGWLPVVSDFLWAGSSVLGHGASILIASGQAKVPATYTTCTGKGNGFMVAQSKARSIEGTYTAAATHGGILASSSQGYGHISADGNLAGAYSYSWSYEGEGRVLGIEQKVKEAIDCDRMGQICDRITLLPIEIYGAGADEDSVTK